MIPELRQRRKGEQGERYDAIPVYEGCEACPKAQFYRCSRDSSPWCFVGHNEWASGKRRDDEL
jgi:hypothetical protein